MLIEVITADEELGEVKVYSCDENGKLLLADNGESVRTKWLRGVVRIEMPNRCRSCGRRTYPKSAGDDLDCGGDCWACVNAAEQL